MRRATDSGGLLERPSLQAQMGAESENSLTKAMVSMASAMRLPPLLRIAAVANRRFGSNPCQIHRGRLAVVTFDALAGSNDDRCVVKGTHLLLSSLKKFRSPNIIQRGLLTTGAAG